MFKQIIEMKFELHQIHKILMIHCKVILCNIIFIQQYPCCLTHYKLLKTYGNNPKGYTLKM